MEAGLIEFGLFGYHGASTAAIAARADVPQPHVYASFETKRELFLTCLDAACASSVGATPGDASSVGASSACGDGGGMTGSEAGDEAGYQTGDQAGSEAGDQAGDEAGDQTGSEAGGVLARAEYSPHAHLAPAPVARFLFQAVAAASTFDEIPARLSAVRVRLGDASFFALLERGAGALLGE